MNCELCQKELESYCEGKLPGNIRIQVKAHLNECAKCTELYQSIVLTNRVISEEKELKPNPFLSTRIMAEIEKRESILSENTSVFTRVIRPVFITASIAAAIFTGVILGNLGNTQEFVPAEFELMDDMEIELDLMLVNE
jgi:predicted anti-sigma-YlaC factor YlaD